MGEGMTINQVIDVPRPVTGVRLVDHRPVAAVAATPAAATRPRRFPLRRILLWTALTFGACVLTVAAFAGYTIYRIDRAVHHVAISPALLAKGRNDLLAVVRGPDHSEEIYAFNTVSGHTNVLHIPATLEVAGPGGSPVALSTLNIHSPALIIAGVQHLGIPVGRYVGVDLHTVSPKSQLGKLATGKLSVTSLISDPTGTSSLIASVASHVYLGPHTPTSALLDLMRVPAAHPVAVPTSHDAEGRVVLASPFADILRKFL